HDQGIVSAVLSEHATVARFEGDTERTREFHRYVDADIYETAERYWRARVAAAYEAAAQEVDCGCKCRDAVLAAETKVDRWYACAQSTCAAMSARDIRALTPDDAKATLEAVRREERQFGIPVAAALAAAISLLERGGKQAAASDKMFDQMLTDYQRALNDYRALINKETTE
ncbi:hypothetical protein KC887_10100, partial [Candidatus Kaiserbacteria bacterium]|nr:hypothetical protein [Candidatus Kaiserbacteria bacterium]